MIGFHILVIYLRRWSSRHTCDVSDMWNQWVETFTSETKSLPDPDQTSRPRASKTLRWTQWTVWWAWWSSVRLGRSWVPTLVESHRMVPLGGFRSPMIPEGGTAAKHGVQDSSSQFWTCDPRLLLTFGDGTKSPVNLWNVPRFIGEPSLF